MNLFPISRTPRVPMPAPRTGALRGGAVLAFGTAFLMMGGSSFAQSAAQSQSPTPAMSPAHNSTPAQDPVIARVGDTDIRESDIRVAEEGIGNQIPPQEGKDRREYLIAFLSDMIRLSKAAQLRNVGDEAEIRRRMEFTRKKALMDELMEATARNAATDEAVRKTYDDYVEKNPSEPALHLRFMLFKFPGLADQAAVAAAEARAEEAIKLIAGGEDFRAVAVKASEDPGAKIDSGDLGFVTRTQMGKEYAEVAFKLAEGEVSRPIRTEFGWHVIRVEGKRISKPVEFDQMHAPLAAYLTRNAQLQLLAQLRQAMPIERLDQAAAVPAEPGK